MPNRYSETFKSTNGPGDARPTAQQIIEDEGLVGNMKDKVIVLTGCSSGIGIPTARSLTTTGARLFLGVRSLTKGQSACSTFLSPGRVELLELDTSSLTSIRRAASEILSKTPHVNILICNAGIMMNPVREVSSDGFELQFATNYLGHFLLFYLLKDAMLKAASLTPKFNSRLVNVSSSGHHVNPTILDNLNLEGEGVYNGPKGYGNSKTAQIWMANYVDRVFGARGLHALSLMPGGIATGLQVNMSEEMKEGMKSKPEVVRFMKSPEQGAATTVLAAVGKEWEGKGGRYLEDCDEAGPLRGGEERGVRGFESWAYNEEREKELWGKTVGLLGLEGGGSEEGKEGRMRGKGGGLRGVGWGVDAR